MSQDGHADEPLRYSMVIEWEPEGGVFVVTVPELPWCRTHGATYEEAVAQAQEAIAGWIEVAKEDGYPIPPPRYLDLDAPAWPQLDAAKPVAAGARSDAKVRAPGAPTQLDAAKPAAAGGGAGGRGEREDRP